ncbi:MAG: hypothetical protein ACXWPK_15780, partial [Isosphaeraceae bacterium]
MAGYWLRRRDEAAGFVTAWLVLFACAYLQSHHHDLQNPTFPALFHLLDHSRSDKVMLRDAGAVVRLVCRKGGMPCHRNM